MDNSLSEALRLHPDYSTRFANHLLRTLWDPQEADKNIAISPARLQAIMILLANWASPSIRKEILERVGNDIISLEEATMLSSRKRLLVKPVDWVNDNPGEYYPIIEQQAILWADNKLQVNVNAISRVVEDIAMSLKQVDFKDSSLKKQMDKSICDATHGLIKELGLQLNEDTVAVIADILYFKASWSSPFDKYDTKDQVFYGTKGKQKVPMMKQTDDYYYQETSSYQLVCLPYRCFVEDDVRFTMRVYLPKPKHSFDEVLSEIWDSEFSPCTELQEVKLSLPRFSVESNIDMKELLPELGLDCIFNSNDLIPESIKDLRVQQFIQQIKVEVNESGTEAAAVTSMCCEVGCAPFERPEPIVMKVNRPFMFEIAEESTKTILFAGIINNIE